MLLVSDTENIPLVKEFTRILWIKVMESYLNEITEIYTSITRAFGTNYLNLIETSLTGVKPVGKASKTVFLFLWTSRNNLKHIHL